MISRLIIFLFVQKKMQKQNDGWPFCFCYTNNTVQASTQYQNQYISIGGRCGRRSRILSSHVSQTVSEIEQKSSQLLNQLKRLHNVIQDKQAKIQKLEQDIKKKDQKIAYISQKHIQLENTRSFQLTGKKIKYIGNKNEYVLQVDSYLGKGTFGTVYQGYLMTNYTQKIAIKEIQAKISVNNLKREYDALKQLQHRNILKFIDYCFSHNKTYFITELCDNSLQKQIEEIKQLNKRQEQIKNAKIFYEKKVFMIVEQLVSGMKFMHDKKFIHRDLKPQNILLKNRCVKIADFGTAKLVQEIQVPNKHTPCGTLFYQSPQMQKDQPYSQKCDVWAVGCIIYQMLTGQKLFENISLYFDKEFIRQVNSPQVNSPHTKKVRNRLSSFNPFWTQLVVNLLSYNQADRKSFVEIEKVLKGNAGLFK